MILFNKNSILIFFFFAIIFSNERLNEERNHDLFQEYTDILNMIYFKDNDFIQINKKINSLKQVKNIDLLCNKNKNNVITLHSINDKDEKYFLKQLSINNQDDLSKIIILISIHTFLFGDVKVEFSHSDFNEEDRMLSRTFNMLSHFRKNYKSFSVIEHKILYEDDSMTFWLKNEADESTIIAINNSPFNKQISLDLSDLKPNYALSLLDRSMVRFDDGKANFNLSKYQTKMFNLK